MIKQILRKLFIKLHLDITKNIKYDRLTEKIMKKLIQSSDNCIDVGCHKGEMLKVILQLAPNGEHYAFEPIPSMYSKLLEKYNKKANIFPYALSDENGESTFQFVKNAPAYSGIKQRKYDVQNPDIEEINVELKRLDDLIPEDKTIHFIKIDVEGAEWQVLKGGHQLLKRDKPTILFECGKGATDYYNTHPLQIFDLLNDSGLKIFTLQSYLDHKASLSAQQFETYFNTNQEYYFIATK